MHDEIPDWMTVEERVDGPAHLPWAVVIRGELASRAQTRASAEVLATDLARAWYAELQEETRSLLEAADLHLE